MAFREIDLSLTDNAIENTHRILGRYKHTANPRPAALPELTEPYPCENCRLINACAKSGASCIAFNRYVSKNGKWKAADIGCFCAASRAKKKAIEARLNALQHV